ncbi:YlxR family protein [Ruminococcaceae bacterium OttesenSCG-928-I18]|nr:YlxR family protein [Ruminococcaceae bacterium OttesenSCG-928-I18]
MKKIPIRRCVGCGEGKPKKELVRVVYNKAGEISLDTTGRAPGRGAYLCHDTGCLAKAKKRKSLERAFETAVPPEIYEALGAQLEKKDGQK